jgi:hypothetical protein
MMNEISQTNPREVPGSAGSTHVSSACVGIAMTMVVLIMLAAIGPSDDQSVYILDLSYGLLVFCVWLVCAMFMLALGLWARACETDGISTIADMVIIKALACCVGGVAILVSFCLGL